MTTMAENGKDKVERADQVTAKVTAEAGQTLRLLAILDENSTSLSDYIARLLEAHATDNPVQITRSKGAPVSDGGAPAGKDAPASK